MADKLPIARVAPGPVMGKSKGSGYRIVGPDDKPLKTSTEKPVDGGGYPNENLAKMRAGEINEYYDKRAKELEENAD